MAAASSSSPSPLSAAGFGRESVSDSAYSRFLRLAVGRRPPLPRGRFEALVSDMASIARGEESEDALLGYEM